MFKLILILLPKPCPFTQSEEVKIAAKEGLITVLKNRGQGSHDTEFVEFVFTLMPELDFSQKVTPENTIFLLFAYSQHNNEFANQGALERKEIVEEKLGESKKLVLQKLDEIRDRILKGEDEDLNFELSAINEIASSGVPHYRIIERTAQYIDSLRGDSAEVKGVASSLMKKFSSKDKKELNYSHNNYASFYEKAMAIKQRNPKIYLPVLRSFDLLTVNHENFEMMQESIMSNVVITTHLISICGDAIGQLEIKKL